MDDSDEISPGSPPDDTNDFKEFTNRFKLEKATSLDDVNQNFETVHDMGFSLFQMMRENSRISNENFLKLHEETNTTLNKMASDIKSILPAQYMAVTIGIIMLGFIVVVVKALFMITKMFFTT